MDSSFSPISRFKELKQQLQNLPLPETEESILLRVVTQILVVVGIVATDVAAGTQLFVWAVPLSIAGGVWSWWRRKQRNIAVKFVLAIGMLAALLVFFGNLIENINDTRLVLAELLIHVQILHSFDLPRRRDLGYSMVIGLILLAVAGTLSETLAFGPFIVLFLAIALPTLLLDYRSRLGLLSAVTPQASAKSSSTVSQSSHPLGQWPRLVLLFVLVTGLGLTFFTAMPRSQGYQLQSFPVNAPGEFENFRFEGEDRSIINPGTEGEEEETGAGGPGTVGEGENTQLYYGFDQSFDQTQPQEPPDEPVVVMRVRSQAPGFWRVLGFDRYTGTGWEMSRDDQTVTLRRPSWTYRFAVTLLDPPQQAEPIIQTYSIATDMPNLLPALSHPTTLYFSTPEIATDPEGGLRSPAPLTEDLTYTVISNVPVRDRQRLGQASTLYPDRITKYYLQLPDGVAEAVRPIAEELLATAKASPDNPYEIALFLAQALKQNYQINPDIFLFPGMELTTAFLSQGGGYPDQFSTVLTVMLRSLGIPARMAAGFAPGEFNPFTGFYVVRNTDAFFLTEVYFPNQGWYTFDPIPGHEVVPPSYVDNETFGVVRQAWNWVASWLPSPVRAWLTTAFGLVFGSIIRFTLWLWQWMSSSLVGFLIGLIGLTGVSFAGWFAALNVGRWWRFRRLFRRPPMERLYRQMLLVLETKGDRKPAAQTPLEYAYACQQRYPAAIADPILRITNAYLQWRYNQQAPTDLAPLQTALRTVQKQSRLTFS